MLKLVIALTLLFFIHCASAEIVARKSYTGHRVFRCIPDSQIQLEKLRATDLDFWLEPRKIGSPIDIASTRENLLDVQKLIDSIGLKCSVMIEDVQAVMDAEAKIVGDKDVPFLQNYHEWTEIYSYIDSLAASFPNLAKTSVVGSTYQGKDIKAITISTNPSAGKPTMWFDGGIHAREWITTATMTYIADSLVRNYGTSADVNSILDNFDVIICPIVNVDGYEYTWHGDRNWRKTRSPTKLAACPGTDPNRNWGFHWGEAGTSTNPCSDSYQGASAASEKEVQALQSYICDHNSTIKSYINFHSYSQLWMSPWGYTSDKPKDFATQNALSAAATKAIQSVYGTTFDYGPISTTIYPASGSSADYTYGVCGVKYSYGVELRDTGKYGFLLPADQIAPSGIELLAGIKAMADFIKANP